MLDLERRHFISLLGYAAVASSLVAHAQDSPTAAVPQIEMARVRPKDNMPPNLRLGDDLIDLMKSFSLSGAQGIGGAWEIPPYTSPADGFAERYGLWCNHVVPALNRLPWYKYDPTSAPCSPTR
jgi:hypothetical protein